MSRTQLSLETTPSTWCKPVDPVCVGRGSREGGDIMEKEVKKRKPEEEGRDRRGEEQEVERGGRMSSAWSPVTLCVPSPSRVPEATTLPPDASVVMHQWTYAIRS